MARPLVSPSAEATTDITVITIADIAAKAVEP
jgi:hypothetical protein